MFDNSSIKGCVGQQEFLRRRIGHATRILSLGVENTWTLWPSSPTPGQRHRKTPTAVCAWVLLCCLEPQLVQRNCWTEQQIKCMNLSMLASEDASHQCRVKWWKLALGNYYWEILSMEPENKQIIQYLCIHIQENIPTYLIKLCPKGREWMKGGE